MSPSSWFTALTLFDTVEYVSGWEHKLRPWLPALTCLHEAQGARHTPVCASLKILALAFVEHLLHARCCAYLFVFSISLNPYNRHVQIQRPHFPRWGNGGWERLSPQGQKWQSWALGLTDGFSGAAPSHALFCLPLLPSQERDRAAKAAYHWPARALALPTSVPLGMGWGW